MITTPGGLDLALEQLGRVYTAIAALRAEHPRASDSWLSVMAEGWLDQARELLREIEDYAGATALEEARAELWLAVKGRGIGEKQRGRIYFSAPSDASVGCLRGKTKGTHLFFSAVGRVGWLLARAPARPHRRLQTQTPHHRLDPALRAVGTAARHRPAHGLEFRLGLRLVHPPDPVRPARHRPRVQPP